MKSLFRPTPEGPAYAGGDPGQDKVTGWASFSGKTKLLLAGGAVAAVMAAVIVPGLGTHQTVQVQTATQTHTPSQIRSYTPPEAPDLATRATGGTAAPATVMVRHIPVPTEMELYSGAGFGDVGAGAARPVNLRSGVSGPANLESGVSDTGSAGSAGGGQSGNSASDVQLASQTSSSDGFETNHATLVHNAEFTIRAGDVIPCLPIDAQDSSRPGYTSCRVPEWYRSSDQRRGLLPPGTRIFGHIASGISNGQRRLGVIYTRIETPEFNMTLNAPGADVMGRAGLDGDVHTFFWDKVGAVAVYALMDVAVGAGTNLATTALSNSFAGGGTTLDFGNQAQSLASQEFQSWSDRPPILTRDQALPITVTVGQDLDFSQACRLALTVNPMACPLQ